MNLHCEWEAGWGAYCPWNGFLITCKSVWLWKGETSLWSPWRSWCFLTADFTRGLLSTAWIIRCLIPVLRFDLENSWVRLCVTSDQSLTSEHMAIGININLAKLYRSGWDGYKMWKWDSDFCLCTQITFTKWESENVFKYLIAFGRESLCLFF